MKLKRVLSFFTLFFVLITTIQFGQDGRTVYSLPENTYLSDLQYLNSSYNASYLKLNNWIVNGNKKLFKIGTQEYENGIAFDMYNHGNYCYAEYNIGQMYDSISGVFGTDDMDTGKNQMIIYGDGKELYRSMFAEKGREAIPVQVNVKGIQILRIYFDTSYGDYPVFSNAVLQVGTTYPAIVEGKTKLSDVSHLSSSYDSPFYKINNWVVTSGGQNIEKKFKIGTQEYDNGIAFSMYNQGNYCYAEYNIGQMYDSISGVFGTDDMDTGKNQMIIYGDGKELYRSMFTEKGREAIPVNVNIKGVQVLRIYFDTSYGDYPVFADAVLQVGITYPAIVDGKTKLSDVSHLSSSYDSPFYEINNWVVTSGGQNIEKKFKIGTQEYDNGIAFSMYNQGNYCYAEYNIGQMY
ncbi:MAG: NPCBM/NEW2 domain-containing protein, partial [Bacillota bacterium]|nr:NPCBM/NEW2 domain-containing protein [Bacillota bacterium]